MLPVKIKSADNFQTPAMALRPLLPYLNKDWVIWECAAGTGNLVKGLTDLGYKAIGTDIIGGYDFLSYEPKKYDCIITNPPFSIKQKFLERCYNLKKPFALLLPLTTLETKKRQTLFKKHGVEIIFFDQRINFETPNQKNGGAWFATAWFTNNLNIGQPLNFTCLLPLDQKQL